MDRECLPQECLMQEWKPDYVVLGPGGIRGLYIIGAYQRLKARGRMNMVKGFGCSSVGAVVGLMLISGYDPMQIITMGVDTKLFTDFFSVKLGEKMAEMKENHGLVSNIPIKRQLEEAVIAKFGSIPTLEQLYQTTRIEFYISTYNVTDQKLEIKSHYTDPNMPCVIAVLLSTNIPFFFYRIIYEGKIYMDAALICPLVIFPFEDGHSKILTIFVDVESGAEANPDSDGSEMLFTQYIHRILMAPVRILKQAAIANSSSRCRHLCLVSRFQDITGASLSPDDKASMVITGLVGADTFLSFVDGGRDSILHKVDNLTEQERMATVSGRVIYGRHPTRTLEQIANRPS